MSLSGLFSGFSGISVAAFLCGLAVLGLVYLTGCIIYSLFLWKRRDGEPFELRMPFLKIKTGYRAEAKPAPPQLPEQPPSTGERLPKSVGPDSETAT
ncbi:hypothetical protein [Amycolatopsis sp. lyj-23]|uniref:hypothetical protein n=1 Tax=Amycolatopsis sp. lyj-23 TaxID=2789283 RepID=UPI00397E017B